MDQYGGRPRNRLTAHNVVTVFSVRGLPYMTSASAQKGGVSKNTHNLKTININFADRGGQKYEEFLDVIHGSSLSLVMGRGRSGSDRRERTVRSVLKY